MYGYVDKTAKTSCFFITLKPEDTGIYLSTKYLHILFCPMKSTYPKADVKYKGKKNPQKGK